MLTARLQDRELSCRVDGEVGERIGHGVQMAGLAGKVEQIVLSLDQMSDRVRIPDIADVDAHLVPDTVNVEEVPAVARNQAVDDRHPGTQLAASGAQGWTR